jgi:hypothetical protein
MIDNFALALSHGLIAVAIWRLLRSNALDVEAAEVPDEAGEPEPVQRRA